jgi:glycosyltransferase involved in cell wall biosynthesis
MADKVSFVGSIPYFELLDRYRAADVFVFPSVWNEPFGLPVAEAMACGVPVVATRSGGIVEIVEDGETGLLVERGNAAELAGAIGSLLADDARRVAMGRAAAQRANEVFAWERVAVALGGVYRGI